MGCRSAPSLCASEMRYFPRGGVTLLQGASAMRFGADIAVGQRNNCRKIVLVSIKVATFTPNCSRGQQQNRTLDCFNLGVLKNRIQTKNRKYEKIIFIERRFALEPLGFFG